MCDLGHPKLESVIGSVGYREDSPLDPCLPNPLAETERRAVYPRLISDGHTPYVSRAIGLEILASVIGDIGLPGGSELFSRPFRRPAICLCGEAAYATTETRTVETVWPQYPSLHSRRPPRWDFAARTRNSRQVTPHRVLTDSASSYSSSSRVIFNVLMES